MSTKDADRLAIVTGTSSGIGAVLAQDLIDRGWTVVGMSRRSGAVSGPGYRHIEADLSDLASLEVLTRMHLAPLLTDPRWTRIGLVNNAALAGPSRGLELCDPFEMARVLRVNTVAPTFLMGSVARTAPPAVPLRIVNVSSGAAGRGIAGLGEYCASKGALRLAGMSLAAELGSEERPGGARPDAAILSYEPGVVDTPMQVSARSGTAEEAPWNRMFVEFAAQGMLQPAEAVIGEIVAFLEGTATDRFVERRFGA